jgi:hypothetical protein
MRIEYREESSGFGENCTICLPNPCSICPSRAASADGLHGRARAPPGTPLSRADHGRIRAYPPEHSGKFSGGAAAGGALGGRLAGALGCHTNRPPRAAVAWRPATPSKQFGSSTLASTSARVGALNSRGRPRPGGQERRAVAKRVCRRLRHQTVPPPRLRDDRCRARIELPSRRWVHLDTAPGRATCRCNRSRGRRARPAIAAAACCWVSAWVRLTKPGVSWRRSSLQDDLHTDVVARVVACAGRPARCCVVVVGAGARKLGGAVGGRGGARGGVLRGGACFGGGPACPVGGLACRSWHSRVSPGGGCRRCRLPCQRPRGTRWQVGQNTSRSTVTAEKPGTSPSAFKHVLRNGGPESKFAKRSDLHGIASSPHHQPPKKTSVLGGY